LGKGSSTKRFPKSGTILSGKVLQIFQRDEEISDVFADTHFLAQILVTEFERCEIPTPTSKIAYINYRRSKQRPKNFVGSNGQFRIPKIGEDIKVYIKRNKLGSGANDDSIPVSPDAPPNQVWQVLEPNGIDIIAKKQKEKEEL